MDKRTLMKRILAGVLAAMLGLSALGGIVMAFADTKEADEDFPYGITHGEEYIPADEDWELYLFENDTENVTLYFEERAQLTLTPDSADTLWLGWTEQYNSIIEGIANEHLVNFDVLEFVFENTLNHPVTMTFNSKNPYLYRIVKGELVAVDSEYKDGVHTFTTDVLDCFVASDDKIAL